MFGFNNRKQGTDGFKKCTPSDEEEGSNIDVKIDEISEQVDSLIEKIGAPSKPANETPERTEPAAGGKGAGGIAATVEPAGAVKHEQACEYCGNPVDAMANQTGDRHDTCRKEYRQRDKNSLCVCCGKKHGFKRKKCSKYENYGTPKPVMRKCEYCDESVNPTLNDDKKYHDECRAEWHRRVDNDLCWRCGEEILDPKAEASRFYHDNCDGYEGFGACDQHLDELAGGFQAGAAAAAGGGAAPGAGTTPSPPSVATARRWIAPTTATVPFGQPAAPSPDTGTASTYKSPAFPGPGPRERPKPLSYDSVGGLDKEIKKLREAVELPLLYPDMFTDAGISAPKGILLYGPPGTGKTLLAKTIAVQTGVNFTYVSAPSLLGKWVGDTERWTRKIFKNAIASAPAVIFIDEIDSLGKDRVDADRNYQIDMTEQLLASMDDLEGSQVVVIGATNRPNALDPALRRPGRFDLEIEIGMPDERGRHDILKIHTQNMPLARVNLKRIAKYTHGFTGADIMAVVKEAGMSAIRNITKNNPKGTEPSGKQVRITDRDFERAMKAVRPSMLRDTECAVPDVGWNDIGGLDYVRDAIMEDVEWPSKYPKEYARMGIRTSRGILLHGPPGTGKTMIAKAVAHGIDSNFITVGCPELISKHPGDTEKNIKSLFEKARRARPCVIFFDEIDALLPERRYGIDNNRIVSQILQELDGVVKSEGVILIGATNMVDTIDKAALRPGRFDKIIEIRPPDREGRQSILEVHIGKKPHDGMDFKRLAAMTEGFTGADIAQMVNAASITLLRRHIESKGNGVADLRLTHEAVEGSVLAARHGLNLPAPNYALEMQAP